MQHAIDRLYRAIQARQRHASGACRTSKLLPAGRTRIASKLGKEAVEVVIEAMRNDAGGVIAESADLLYHLTVLWADLGIEPVEIWNEMDRRELVYGIAEKIRKAGDPTGRVRDRNDTSRSAHTAVAQRNDRLA